MIDDLPAVYMQIHELPERHWPARARRRRGITLLWVQPGTLKAELVFWAKDNLTAAERTSFRLAWGQPEDLSLPIADCLLEGDITPSCIPLGLRIPTERYALRSA